MKLAAIEAEWETEEAPAAFTLFGMPDREAQETHHAVKIPWLLGIIATRSIDTEAKGIKELVAENEMIIREGIHAYALLKSLKTGNASDLEKESFDQIKENLGYGLLLKKYTDNVVDATEEQIRLASVDTAPNVPVLFWSFRLMVASGSWMLLVFGLAFIYSNTKKHISDRHFILKLALISLPFPWIASEAGWIVAEMGRQPWSIAGISPTNLSTSTLTADDLYFSLTCLIGFYSLLFIVEMFLMLKYTRLGPSSLHTGRYHFEKLEKPEE